MTTFPLCREIWPAVASLLMKIDGVSKDEFTKTAINAASDHLSKIAAHVSEHPEFSLLTAVVATAGLEHCLDDPKLGTRRRFFLDIRQHMSAFVVLAGLAMRMADSSTIGFEMLQHIRGPASRFAAAFRPHPLWRASENRAEFNRRLDAFVTRLDSTAEEVLEWARRALEALHPPMDEQRRVRFFEKVPVARLRVCDDGSLLSMAGYFRDWDPLIEYLEDPRKPSPQESRLQELCKSLAATMRRTWPGVFHGFDADDAVQDALTGLLETADDPYAGYIYDTHLVAWLTKTARFGMTGHFRQACRLYSIDDFES